MIRPVFLQRARDVMRSSMKKVLIAGVTLATVWGFGGFGRADAEDESHVAKSPRGGLLAKAPHHQFEVFFYQTGVRVFPQNAAGQSVDISGATGTATFYHPNSPHPWFIRPLSFEAATTELPQASLVLSIGLSTVPPTGAKVTLEVAGLPESDKATVTA